MVLDKLAEVSGKLHVDSRCARREESTILVTRMGRFTADLDMVIKIKHPTGNRIPVCDSFSSLMN
jgi:hypothetical protein